MGWDPLGSTGIQWMGWIQDLQDWDQRDALGWDGTHWIPDLLGLWCLELGSAGPGSTGAGVPWIGDLPGLGFVDQGSAGMGSARFGVSGVGIGGSTGRGFPGAGIGRVLASWTWDHRDPLDP